MNKKNSCVLCRNFIRIHKINRTLHRRLGLRILSSLAESIDTRSKIKFVSPRGHVISSISSPDTKFRHWKKSWYFISVYIIKSRISPNREVLQKILFTGARSSNTAASMFVKFKQSTRALFEYFGMKFLWL